MKRILLALCLLLPAASAKADVMVMGDGLDSCGAWLQNRRTNSWALEMQWVLGYVTGMNAGIIVLRQVTGKSTDVVVDVAGTDPYGVAGWLDNWCRAHPTENLYKASDAFFGDRLIKNKRAVSPKTEGR
jgi:hypothetical protein